MALGLLSTGRVEPGAASEMQTLAGISAAHLISHIYMLTLPVLLPLLKERLGVGFFELGLALTIFNVVSGLTQAPMGFLVDRIGARVVLVAGLCLGGAAFAVLGMTISYPMLIVVSVAVGLANCVYHPADYAILTQSISGSRIGRAFSIHTFAGFLGGAIAPVMLLGLNAWFGLTVALVCVGLLGPLVAAVLMVLPQPARPAGPPARKGEAAGGLASVRAILTPTVLSLMLFFTVLSLSNSSISNFSVVALMAERGLSLASASTALTAYLGMAAIGVLAGGYLADRTQRHGDVAALGFGLTAIIVLTVGLVRMPTPLLVLVMGCGGFLSGMIMPSRDMLVRKASPPGAEGRVFGLVSTGFNIGGIIGPLLFGWIMDHAAPFWIFGVSALFMALTALYGFASDRRAPAPARG